MHCLPCLLKDIDISVTNMLGLISLQCMGLPCRVLEGGFRQWCFTDSCILKAGFAPVEAVQPALHVALSGKQAACNEADGCLPAASRSLSVIYPSSFFYKWFGSVGFLIGASLSPIACSPSRACVCVRVRERGRQRGKPCLGYADRRLFPQLSGFEPVSSAAGKWKKKIQFQGGGSEAGGQQRRGSPCDAEQPCRQRPALGPMRLLSAPGLPVQTAHLSARDFPPLPPW